MAVHRPAGRIGIGNTHAELTNELAVLLRHRVSDRIRDVDRAGAFPDDRFEYPAQEVRIRAAAVFGRELDIVAMPPRESHRQPGCLEDLVRCQTELPFHVQRARGDERVKSPGAPAFQRLDCERDVLLVGAAQTGHRCVAHRIRHRLHRFEIAARCRREAGLDHVDPQPFELPRNPDLFVPGHRRARTLLAVS